MFVAHAANVNGFKLGCKMVLFIDDTLLSGPYTGNILVAYALDVDNHLFNFTYVIEFVEKIDD